MSVPSISRRQLVGGLALAAAGGLTLGNPGRAGAQSSAESAAILGAVRFEQGFAVAYAGMAVRPGLGHDLRDLLARLADHERQHAAALLELAEFLGSLPPPVPSLRQVEQAIPGLRAAADEHSALALLDELERAEILAFYHTEQILTDTKLIELVGAVMCSDAQHLVLVRQAAGRDPIPSALESGQAR